MIDQHSSAVPVVLMLCLVGMCVVVGLLIYISEPEGAHGSTHSQFASTMNRGSTGSDRLTEVRWLGLVFALLQVTLFVVCLLLGFKQHRPVLGWFAIGGLFYGAAFGALVVAESAYVHADVRNIVLGFPLPTAIMIYGVGGVPIMFSVFYVLRFDQWFLKPQDLQRIDELLAQRRRDKAERCD